MLDMASKIVAFIVAAIGAATAIYNVFFRGERKRKKEYYDCLLKPFAVAYKNDPNVNTLEFVQSRAKRANDSIPKYIFFLLDAQTSAEDELVGKQKNDADKTLDLSNDRLKKVLISDYITLYPNEHNMKWSLFDFAGKMIEYLMFLFTFLFIVVGSFVLTGGVMLLISSLLNNPTAYNTDCWNGIKCIVIGLVIAFSGIVPIRLSECKGGDMYSIKKRCIVKEIKKKVILYDKRFGEYVL